MSSVNSSAFRRLLTPTANEQSSPRIYITEWRLKHLIFYTCLLTVAFMPSAVSAARTCKPWEYLDGGRCKSCSNRRCEPGQRQVEPCGSGKDVVCEDCVPLAEGYTCESGAERTCVLCDRQGKKTVRHCDKFSQTVCGGCLEGYFAQATHSSKVVCIPCEFDKANSSDCPVKVKETGNQDSGASEEVSQQKTHLQSPGIYTMAAVSVTFGAVMFLLLITAVISARLGLWENIKHRLKRRNHTHLSTSDSLDPEIASSTCVSKSDADESCPTSGSSSTDRHREPANDVGYHQEKFVAQPASATVCAIPDYPWPAHEDFNESTNLVDKPDMSKELEGTSSPFRITDDESQVFVFPQVTTRTVSESSEGPPSSPVVVLAGQTAQVHKTTKRTPGNNQTANTYRTKLAKYLQPAYEIQLRDDWFNFDRQQHLSAQLDQIPPAASLPNWRTFFESLGHLEKLDLDSVNNARVDSPTLALFKVLETRNVENMLTVGHVLEALDKTKFTTLVDYLCDEIKNTDFSEPSQV